MARSVRRSLIYRGCRPGGKLRWWRSSTSSRLARRRCDGSMSAPSSARSRSSSRTSRTSRFRARRYRSCCASRASASRGSSRPRCRSARTWTAPGGKPPYEDVEGPDGLVRYAYRGTDPDFFENRALRLAYQHQLPLIWFVATSRSSARRSSAPTSARARCAGSSTLSCSTPRTSSRTRRSAGRRSCPTASRCARSTTALSTPTCSVCGRTSRSLSAAKSSTRLMARC